MIETPATPIPEDKTTFTFPVQSSRSTSPSTVQPPGSPSSSTTKPSVAPSFSIVKPSMSPSSPTVKSSAASSTSPGKSLASKSPYAVKLSGSLSPNAAKTSVSTSTVKSSESRITPSASPVPSSKRNNIAKKVSINEEDSTFEKPLNKPETQAQDRAHKKNSIGPGGAWLFDDHSEPTMLEKNTNNDSATMDSNKATGRGSNISPTDKNKPDDNLKASLTNVSISVPLDNESAPENAIIGTKKELKSTDKEDGNGKRDDIYINNLNSGNGKNPNNQDQSSRTAKPKGELAEDASSAVEKSEPENAEVMKDESGRTIEITDEEEDDDDDDDDNDEYDDEEEEEDGDEDKEGAATTGEAAGGHNGARKSKKRGRRKKLGYGKLKWNAASKVDTGSGTRSNAPRRSIKKIPRYKNDYSHVRSRVTSVSEGSTGEKVTDSPITKRKQSENEEKRIRSQSLYRPPPEYIKVRPRLYNEGRRYSEMPRHSTMPYSVKQSSR